MRELTPTFILENIGADNRQGEFAAVTLFVDTSGFTPLTARLSEQGRDGAEVLAEILLAVFEPLIEAVYAHGGFLAGFAGDAFKAVFPGMTPESYLGALAAAEEIRAHMAGHPTHETRYGFFDFLVRVSLADGVVSWAVWSSANEDVGQSSGYTFAGSAIDQAIQGEDHVAGGEVAATDAFLAALQSVQPELVAHTTLTGHAAGYVRIDGIGGRLPAPVPPVRSAASRAAAGRFYPTALLTMQTQGEFRPVYSVFLNVQQLPDPGTDNDFLPTFFQLLNQYGGYLCRIGRIGASDTGGTFLLFWGAPTSHENDLNRALSFLLELQTRIDFPLRAGLTYAIVYAGFIGSPLREEYTCYGTSVNQAARQMGVAAWGQILLDADTARNAGAGFDVAIAGHVHLKGFAEDQPLFALRGRRPETPDALYQGTLVGRQAEMRQLWACVQPILQGRFGGTLVVKGEAGVGKSRLVHEFVAQPKVVAQVRVLHGQTDEILRESLNPFHFLLMNYFAQSPSATPAANQTNFDRIFDALGTAISPATAADIDGDVDADLQETLRHARAPLCAFLGLASADQRYEQLSPQLRFDNLLRAIKVLFLAESRVQPLILVVEDLHWIDVDSQHCLRQLIAAIETYPLLIIATSRLEPINDLFDPVEPQHQELLLNTLSPEAMIELVAERLYSALIESRSFPPPQQKQQNSGSHHDRSIEAQPAPALVELLLQRGEGNPFFVEQLLLYLNEQGLLISTEAGIAPQGEEDILPQDLQSVLIARLDRLTQAVKELVQAAAVLGREFEVLLLSQMLHGDGSVLPKIKAAEEQAIWTPLSELRYLFKHTLLRDAAYNMQLRATLRTMHHVAAAAIETLYEQTIANHYADLVYHYRHSENSERERHNALLAGAHAAERYANSDAVGYYSRALELTPETALQERYDLHLARVKLYDMMGLRDQQEVETAQLEQLAEQLDDDLLRATAALQRADCAMALSDYPTMLSAAQRAVTVADQERDLAADGYIKWGHALIWQGKFGESQYPLDAALRLVQNTYTRQEADTYHHLGLAAMQRGENAESQRYLEQALPIYRELNDPVNEGYVVTIIGLSWRNRGDSRQGMRYIEQALTIWRRAGFRRGELIATGNLGHGYLDRGDYMAAYQQYARTRQVAIEMRDKYHMATVLNNLGLVMGHMGNFTAARHYYEESLTIQRQIGAQQGISLTARNLGLLLAQMGDYEPALRYCQEALTIAQQLNSPFEEGMAHYKLGRVLFELRRWDEAREAYQAARSRLENKPQLAVEVSAALVELMAVQQELAQQADLLTEVVTYLASQPVGINEPSYVYWVCYSALKMQGDSRATQLLTIGYNLIQERAALITDENWRRSYLEEIAVHQKLTNEYAKQTNT